MTVIALVSPKGGVGKTTITANLAATMALEAPGEERVLAIDLDPQNALRLHHRMAPADTRGIAHAAINGEDLSRVCYQGPYRVDCLPYGVVHDEERRDFEALLYDKPDWLLDCVSLFDRRTVFINTPPGPSVYMQQVLNAADVVLVALLSDAASFATLGAMQRYVEEYCPQESERPLLRFVLNQTDATKSLNRDVAAMLRNALGSQVPPFEIHYDASVEEALACHQPVTAYDPNSAAARDLWEIAEWLKNNT